MQPISASSATVGEGTQPLGAILAGGTSRRFGSPKALALLAGVRIVDRVRRAIESTGLQAVMIANAPEMMEAVGLPARADVLAGAGPLGGIHAALAWTRGEGRPGALCVACDMPLVAPALLARLMEVGTRQPSSIVVPESPGRRGIEPLCAYYPTGALEEIEAMIHTGERRATVAVRRLGGTMLPLDEVARFGDPVMMFLNVNTADDLRRAEQAVRERGEGA